MRMKMRSTENVSYEAKLSGHTINCNMKYYVNEQKTSVRCDTQKKEKVLNSHPAGEERKNGEKII